jgi:sugar phosphate isomerase/epimerase
MDQTRLPFGVALHSYSYLGGFVGRGTAQANPRPCDAYWLMDQAVALGLSGIEFPPEESLPGTSAAELARARAYAEDRGLFIVVDHGVVDGPGLQRHLRIAGALGAHVVRVVVSTILCGDRRGVRDTWPQTLRDTAQRLREVSGLAGELGVSIAVENHQDITSSELVALCEAVASPWVGVNLDSVNPLAVVEDQLAFAAAIMPFLKNVHLKDYRIYPTPQGYRLVRCPIGAGVLPTPALLDLIGREAPRATITVELGALFARHVQFLEDDFWPGYLPRRVEEILPVLRLREREARPAAEDWRTPWERQEEAEALGAYELDEMKQSVRYLRTLMGRA